MICCPLTSADDADGYIICYEKKIVVAKKDHKCSECGEDIASGTRYEYASGLWEGAWLGHKTCISCKEIRDHFSCGSGYVLGSLWEDLEENFFPTMTAGGPCMDGLSPEAKGRLFDLRMKWYEEANS